MTQIETEEISLDEIYQLTFNVFSNHGCDKDNATALTRTITNAERDGSLSHGLFRIPGYLASLKSGKVKGDAVNFSEMINLFYQLFRSADDTAQGISMSSEEFSCAVQN